tara:strand:+ start:808 stop:1020 length:213 start_codon:yes stop_codon:yes gene_type:complete
MMVDCEICGKEKIYSQETFELHMIFHTMIVVSSELKKTRELLEKELPELRKALAPSVEESSKLTEAVEDG